MDVTEVRGRAESAGRSADDSAWMDRAVRVGLLSYGVVHLVLAWLALRLALGDGGNASSQGALRQLAKNPVGRVSLYVVAAGFVALVLWQAMEALWGHREHDGAKRLRKRLTSAGKVVVYGALAGSAFTTATGSSGGGGGGTDGPTARLMAAPGGPFIVGAVGLAVLGVAVGIAYHGVSESFTDDMQVSGQVGTDGGTYVWLGKVGHVAKGVAVAIVGALFLSAALTHDPQKSGGLDRALHELLQQPFGGPLLVVMALGFAAYGLFCLAWARYLDR